MVSERCPSNWDGSREESCPGSQTDEQIPSDQEKLADPSLVYTS